MGAATAVRPLRAVPTGRPDDVDVLALFAAQQRSEGRSEVTIENRHRILTHLYRSAGRPLLELELIDLRLHLGRHGIKDSSRRTERAAFVAFYRFAYDDGLRDDDPSMRLGVVNVPRSEPRPFSVEQIDRMLRSGAYRRTRAMILVGYYQGFRVSQIAAVHGRDVDLEERLIRTVAKGTKERYLPLHPVVAELAETMPRDDWWFPARRGQQGHISARGVTDQVHNAKVRAGINNPTLTAHSLRHSFGTHLVDAGVDIRVIQELMAHESLSSTQIYTGVSRELKAAGISMLEPRHVPMSSGRKSARG